MLHQRPARHAGHADARPAQPQRAGARPRTNEGQRAVAKVHAHDAQRAVALAELHLVPHQHALQAARRGKQSGGPRTDGVWVRRCLGVRGYWSLRQGASRRRVQAGVVRNWCCGLQVPRLPRAAGRLRLACCRRTTCLPACGQPQATLNVQGIPSAARCLHPRNAPVPDANHAARQDGHSRQAPPHLHRGRAGPGQPRRL